MGPDTTVHARYTGIDQTTDGTRLDGGRGWRVTRSTTTFDTADAILLVGALPDQAPP